MADMQSAVSSNKLFPVLRSSPAAQRAVVVGILCVAAAAYLTAFLVIDRNGYGENLDNYLMLRAWQMMAGRGVYVPSRFQGNVPSELSLGFLASWFGPTGANALSFVLSLVALAACYALFAEFGASRAATALAVVTVAANPFWVNAASTSMDYLHPLALFLVGVLCLRRNLPVLGAILLGVAAACRISYAPLGLVALGLAIAFRRERATRIVGLQAVCVFFAVAGLLFLPVFIFSHLTFAFIASARPDWQGLPGLLARGAYKHLYLYGLLGTGLVVAYLGAEALRLMRGGARAAPRHPSLRTFVWICVAAILYHAILFFYIPIRIEYLIPTLIAVAGLLVACRAPTAVMAGLAAVQVLYWFVSIDLIDVDHRYADPCAAVQAVAARFSPHLAEGVLLPRFRHDTIEATCMPIRLIERPADVHDRLPRPASTQDPATVIP